MIKQKMQGKHKGYLSSTAERLKVLEREKQKKLNKMRQQLMIESLGPVKIKQNISDSNFRNGRIPVHLRKGNPSDFDHQVENMRNRERRPGSVDDHEYTFHPNIGENYRNRSTNDLFDWNQQRMKRMTDKRITEFDNNSNTFRPSLNRKTEELVN